MPGKQQTLPYYAAFNLWDITSNIASQIEFCELTSFDCLSIIDHIVATEF